MKPEEYYSREDDILSLSFGKVKHSRELKNVNIVVDFNEKDNIVGIEIFDFVQAMDESQKEIDKIFESKKRKEVKNE